MMQDSNGNLTDTPLFGAGQEQGRRENLEDRLRVGVITTAGGLTLTVAMVADGVGGAAFGERAAELAIETVFHSFETTPLGDCKSVPLLMKMALDQAQQAIVAEQRQEKAKRGMGTTAVLAVICQDVLYLANIGDSRAYLVRGDELYQLSRDHSWGLEMLRQGLLKTPDEAARHPKTDELYRSLGSEDNFEVDLGVYLNKAGSEGVPVVASLPLQPDDRLLLCSDGLIRARITGSGHFVEDSEIVYALTHRGPDEAAAELVQRAVGRQADDNVSAIVIEMPGSARKFALPAWTRYAVIGLVGALLLGAIAFLVTRGGDEVVAASATMAPLPTLALNATMMPAAEIAVDEAVPGIVVRLVENGAESATGWTLPDDGSWVLILSGLEPMQLRYEDGSELFLAPGTETALAQAGSDAQLRVQVNQGDVVFRSAGVPVEVLNQVGSWVRIVGPGAMVGVSSRREPAIDFVAHCLAGGPCELMGDLDETTVLSLSTGQAGRVGGPGRAEAQGEADYGLFSAFAAVVPAPTATMTATATEEPTATLPPTQTPTRRPGATLPPSTATTQPTSPPVQIETATPDNDNGPGQPPQPTKTPVVPPTPPPQKPTATSTLPPAPGPTDTPEPGPTDTPEPGPTRQLPTPTTRVAVAPTP